MPLDPSTLLAPHAVAPLASTPLSPSRDEAQDLLERELADPAYQRELTGPIRQAIEDVLRWLDERLGTIGGIDIPYGPLIILVLLTAAIVLAIVLVRPRLQRAAGADDPLDTEVGISSEELRTRAEAHRRAGRVDESYRDVFRAVVRAAEERDILTEMTGRTASEAAMELGRSFPVHARRIGMAADLFNLSRYGGRSLTLQDCDDIAELDALLTAAQPQDDAAAALPQVVAPR
ncbi:DUF4129 domain-containing protein [Nesterenkonia sp. HG001]|uniref:DUF4129 domain-containing protein n=1 Tax=Nesterenkonia sp. HG001 TaxID=2983207 RepID=UPI002AC4037E|nr:DUF4129 domain-containing protein [Nesterenkonia sp. HG001]MDZ5076258.1 DUF4129 domain-containing protein [Nesterenkonia sp. HG001]